MAICQSVVHGVRGSFFLLFFVGRNEILAVPKINTVYQIPLIQLTNKEVLTCFRILLPRIFHPNVSVARCGAVAFIFSLNL